MRFTAVADIQRTPVESFNVVAALPGSDPALRHNWVAYSAHYDHLGIVRSNEIETGEQLDHLDTGGQCPADLPRAIDEGQTARLALTPVAQRRRGLDLRVGSARDLGAVR